MTGGWRALSLDHADPVAPVVAVVRLIDSAGTATAAPYSRSDVVQALHDRDEVAVSES
ncbi:MAG TPA: hypothetical protein VED63_12305 [Acidimicrobiales bacterium]|nr:hypothetical protein [Acidimicrobiales bacterium]